MPHKELIEKCKLSSDTQCDLADSVNEIHPNLSVIMQNTILNLIETTASEQLIHAIPIIAEEIKKELERKVRNWEATTFNDECDGKPPYSMTTLEVRTSWWLTFWKGYVGE